MVHAWFFRKKVGHVTAVAPLPITTFYFHRRYPLSIAVDEQIGLYIFPNPKVRRIALVIVIIAGANHEEITVYFYRVFIMAKDGPDVFGRRPVILSIGLLYCICCSMAALCCIVQIVENGLGIGDHLS